MSKESFPFSKDEVNVDKKITIVASKWNYELVQELVKSGTAHLEMLGITNFKTVYVPGAWELVHAAQKELDYADGVIAYGVVIRGETTHYELISESVAHGLMQISINTLKPIAFGLITTENLQQAKDRVSSSKLNKGREIAQSLVEILD
ncbi:MAG: 6,7-dimethyl-8-ribityllumazine synthase [Gammaproteobacteria bacterium]|nr:6,7-dimethyl-8-ribityllumazine synthase [Gammaproteobacteria bacterium]|tara:strand:+ start:1009 stop:1455 length:447 start_codon:yes stop_codon:yes gene_type:complete